MAPKDFVGQIIKFQNAVTFLVFNRFLYFFLQKKDMSFLFPKVIFKQYFENFAETREYPYISFADRDQKTRFCKNRIHSPTNYTS